MKKYILGGLAWSAFCFWAWIQALFYGFPHTADELMALDPTGYQVAEILQYVIPALWLLAPMVLYAVKTREQEANVAMQEQDK